MNFENLNIWCWIIPILVGILSAILGYLIGKGQASSVVNHSDDLKKLQEENAKLKTDLEACNKKLGVKDTPSKTPKDKASLTPTPPAHSFNATAAKAVFGKKIKQDDLKLVEGIGPKIEGLFHNHGIKTWKALSEASTDKCQEVLNSGGDRYRIHDPASWPMQAKMAYEGQWEQLVKWQDDHKAGKF